ncbi:hypothetical protein D6833_11825 [Candidatus Parcubacteria bacterium]|nr:MAG: hypothetical protein D6833_11825 [Candidatus Parcubacteria bacterium]
MVGFVKQELLIIREVSVTEPVETEDGWQFYATVTVIDRSDKLPRDGVPVLLYLLEQGKEEEPLLTDTEGQVTKKFTCSKPGRWTVVAQIAGTTKCKRKPVTIKGEKVAQPARLLFRKARKGRICTVFVQVLNKKDKGVRGAQVVVVDPELPRGWKKLKLTDKDGVTLYRKKVKRDAALEFFVAGSEVRGHLDIYRD